MSILEQTMELWRWLHILFGIVWIGTLYFLNFVQAEYFKEADGAAKIDAQRKLLPRGLWWFRWAAMLTFLTGLTLLLFLHPGWDLYIVFGATLGTLMFLNVWLVIWPNQKVVIANAELVGEGKEGLPNTAEAAARAACASRHNTLFSTSMLFFMVASAHLGGPGSMKFQNSMTAMALGLLVIALLELNALFGKPDYVKITSVGQVIHMSILLTIALYAIAEFL